MASEVPPVYIGLKGIYVAKTALSYIDGERGKLIYRGYSIEDLAEHSSFEEVTYLLWFGKLPNRKELEEFKENLSKEREIPEEVVEILRKLPKSSHPMDVLKTGVAALGPFDPDLPNIWGQHIHEKRAENLRIAIRILSKMPTIMAYFHRMREGKEIVHPRTDLSHAANFLYMMWGREPKDIEAKLMDVALILHADHGFNASTFACLVTASTLSDLYSAVVTGISTLKGPLHGGANEQALKMLMEIGSPDRARDYVKAKLERKERIMGFGHRVYKAYDPRARILKKYAEMLAKETGQENLFNTALEVEKVMIELLGKKGIFPNVDFYSGQVYHMLGVPTDIFTPIFAISRTSGWIGHVFEYWEENVLIRPRALYVGPMEAKYIPLDERL